MRDDLISQYDLERKAAGDATKRHETARKPLVESASKAEQAHADAKAAVRREDQRHLAELAPIEFRVNHLERALELALPPEVRDAMQRLESKLAFLRNDPDADRELVQRLIVLRAETNLHLLPADRLRMWCKRVDTSR